MAITIGESIKDDCSLCVLGIGGNYCFVFSTEMRFSLQPNRSYAVNAKSSYIEQEKVKNSIGS